MNDDSNKPSEQPMSSINMIDQSSGGGLGANASAAPPIPQKPESNSSNDMDNIKNGRHTSEAPTIPEKPTKGK